MLSLPQPSRLPCWPGSEQRTRCHRGNCEEAAISILYVRVSAVPMAAGLGAAAEGPSGTDKQDLTGTQGCCWQPPPSHGDPPRAARTCSEQPRQCASPAPVLRSAAPTHTRAPLGHRAQPCLSPRECPATLRVPRSPRPQNTPLPPGCVCRCRPPGSPGRCGGRTRPPRSALSRPASPAPSRPRSAPPCPGTARHGTAAPR